MKLILTCFAALTLIIHVSCAPGALRRAEAPRDVRRVAVQSDPFLPANESVPVYRATRVGIFFVCGHVKGEGEYYVGAHHVFVKAGREGFVADDSTHSFATSGKRVKPSRKDLDRIFQIDLTRGILRRKSNAGDSQKR